MKIVPAGIFAFFLAGNCCFVEAYADEEQEQSAGAAAIGVAAEGQKMDRRSLGKFPRNERKCGTQDPSTRVAKQIQAKVNSQAINFCKERKREIETYVHVLMDDQGNEGFLGKRDVKTQIKVLNKAYEKHFKFVLKKINYVANSAWYETDCSIDDDINFKSELRKGGVEALNIYTCSTIDWFGWGSYPWDYIEFPQEDGVVVNWGTVPGSSAPIKNYNQGKELVHQIGHWLGLFTPFYPDGEKTCKGPGDYVLDTPIMKKPAYKCDVKRDTCPNDPGKDPVTNFMNYADDDCLMRFTEGQFQRMRVQYDIFRESA